MTADHNSEIRELLEVIAILFPRRSQPPGRHIVVRSEAEALDFAHLAAATSALANPATDIHVDVEVALKLLEELGKWRWANADGEVLRDRVIGHVERRWSYFCQPLAACAAESFQGAPILDWFPKIKDESVFIDRFAATIANKQHYEPLIEEILGKLAPKTLPEARLLLASLVDRGKQAKGANVGIATALFCAIARGMGWTPWVSLHAILHARPDYVDRFVRFESDGAPLHETGSPIDPRLEMARELEGQRKVIDVAGLVLELVQHRGSLLDRPAETRAAFVEKLSDAIGDDALLRQAVLEAMFWVPSDRAADLAHFAAVSLVQPQDRTTLLELERHPVRVVQYAARAVRAAKFGERLKAGSLPVGGSFIQSLTALDSGTSAVSEPASTWLGDRAVERLIEQTIYRVETRVADEYADHGDEGEDRLLSSLFRELSLRFADLNQALAALARAASAPHCASVVMEYRNVDRSEEGAKGVRRSKSFSADLCLIVDPVIDGTSLGRRVTLVQAKRLYRRKTARKQPTWHSGFKIDRDQRLALQQQTGSSVYFFHGPPVGGRGVPVIPTQLVADLSEHKGSGTHLSRELVAVASRSLADWLTYDVLALRIGDPFLELVERAKGRPGSLPRPLLSVPTVEVRVELAPRSEAR